MSEKMRPVGPSLDTDDHGDPIADDFGTKLSRDLAIEWEQLNADLRPPARVLKVWDAQGEDD